MKKQINLSDSGDTRLDEKICKTMQREFPLPENVETAKMEAFAKIKANQEKQVYADSVAGKTRKARKRRKVFFRTWTAAAAAAAVFSGVCIINPAFAAQIPLVGHVFEEVGQSLGFSGDFSKYAKPLEETEVSGNVEKTADKELAAANGENTDLQAEEASTDSSEAENGDTSGKTLYSETKNGMTVTLSEVYCNDVALYVSMILQTEEKFPDTMLMNDTAPVIDALRGTLKFSYNDRELLLDEPLDGKMVDDHTYACVLRYNLQYSVDDTDYDGYDEKRQEFYEEQGISREEIEADPQAAYEKLADILGVETVDDKTIAEAGGPDINDFIKKVEIPETFHVELHIPQIVGYKPDAKTPEMPEDIRAEYEKAMTDNGLSLADEDYENFTEEQKELEHELFQKMWNAYAERYPETNQNPNSYENWWVDGPWDFTFEVTKDQSQTIVKEINDVNDENIGLVSVTKTPFELMVEDSMNVDTFTVVLDADGEIMPIGTFGGDANTMPLQDRDVSKVDIYICDYIEYMDELKGYYWSDDYEENKKTKTFKQLLDERALYHKEISFQE